MQQVAPPEGLAEYYRYNLYNPEEYPDDSVLRMFDRERSMQGEDIATIYASIGHFEWNLEEDQDDANKIARRNHWSIEHLTQPFEGPITYVVLYFPDYTHYTDTQLESLINDYDFKGLIRFEWRSPYPLRPIDILGAFYSYIQGCGGLAILGDQSCIRWIHEVLRIGATGSGGDGLRIVPTECNWQKQKLL